MKAKDGIDKDNGTDRKPKRPDIGNNKKFSGNNGNDNNQDNPFIEGFEQILPNPKTNPLQKGGNQGQKPAD